MSYDLTFYGTGAAEGIPCPFCDCFLCRNAREKGGKEIRKRTMFRINEEVCIDLGADSFAASQMYGDFIHLQHALITHTHEDHFAYMMMNVRNMAYARTSEPLHLYFTDKAFELVEFFRSQQVLLKGELQQMERDGVIQFHRLEFWQTYQIAGLEVTPLRGNHRGNMDENSALYRIKLPSGKILFYGLDTGYYYPETFDWLREHGPVDYLISECTFGTQPGRGDHPDGHLDWNSCLHLFRQLFEQGTLRAESHIYLTHINHCHNSTHEDLVQMARENADLPCPITVSYDGMQITD